MTETRGRKPANKRRERRMDRKDFGSFRDPLVVPLAVRDWAKRSNKELRIVNDEKGRISQLLAQDWDFVKYIEGQIGEGETLQDMGEAYSVLVGNKESGEPLMGYLMSKDKDWYKEDQILKQKELDIVDDEIRGGSLGGVESSYQPQDGSGRTVTKYKP